MPATACVESVTTVIDELCATGAAEGDGGELVDIGTFAITADAGALLESAVRAVAPQSMLEVGCASALSTLFLCRGLLAGGFPAHPEMHVIDPRQTTHWKNIGRRNIRRAGLDHLVHFHEAPAHDVLPQLVQAGDRIQFAFIDGWHMFDYVMVEAFYCDLMLDEGGVVAIHDLWMPGLQQFASFWTTNRAYEPVSMQRGGLTTEPANASAPILGDLTAASPHFVEHLAPFVDQSVLLLRKVDEDRRAWDDYTDFIGAQATP